MAFKLTYSDGQETDYDDGTVWEVDNGVLKMGREDGEWTVLVSPSHWAVIEVSGAAPPKGEGEDADDDSKSDEDDQDDQDDKDDGAKDDKDDKDEND